MMMPAATFHAVGGMDEGYFLHVDDLDLCFRLHRTGIPVYYTPHVEVVHHAGSSRTNPVQVEWHKMRGFLRYFRVHFHSPRWLPLLGLLGAGIPDPVRSKGNTITAASGVEQATRNA